VTGSGLRCSFPLPACKYLTGKHPICSKVTITTKACMATYGKSLMTSFSVVEVIKHSKLQLRRFAHNGTRAITLKRLTIRQKESNDYQEIVIAESIGYLLRHFWPPTPHDGQSRVFIINAFNRPKFCSVEVRTISSL
jgi:hypothetical protein